LYATIDEPAALAELDRFDELWGKKYPKTVQSWRAN
jgi:transposase-like protein